MADNSRITKLPDFPAGPDSSGLGKLLFERAEKQFQMGQEAKQTDVIEGIRSKYQAEAAAKANSYDKGMEELRSNLSQARTQVAWEHDAELKAKAASGLEAMIGGAAQQGIAMPGLAQRDQTMEAPTPSYEVGNIAPENIDTARTAFAGNLAAHLKRLGDREQMSTEVLQKQLYQTMDLIGPDDARRAKQLAAQFRLHGADLQAATIESQWGTEGSGSRSGLLEFEKKGVWDLQKAMSANALRMAITEEISDRLKAVAKLKIEATKSLSLTKVDNTAYKNLALLHTKFEKQISGLAQKKQLVETEMFTGSMSEQQTRIAMQQLRIIEKEMDDALDQMGLIREKMKASTLSGETPVGTPGTGVSAPRSDPADLWRGKK